MSVLDKMLNTMKIAGEDSEYEDEYGYDEEYDVDEYEEEKPKKKLFAKAGEAEPEYYDEPEKVVTPKAKTTSKVTPMKQQTRRGANGMEVCVIKPTTVDESREITDILLSNRTVVLNLEGLDVETAQRIIDFTSGSCYAIKGNLQKISHYIFIITPASVDISGDFQDLLAGSFNVPPINPEF